MFTECGQAHVDTSSFLSLFLKNMKQNGNVKSNALYNPDERRHPPPTNMIDSERDSELEKYIRSKCIFPSLRHNTDNLLDKYEFKKYMQAAPSSSSFGRFPPLNSSSPVDRSAAVAALLGPSRSAATLPARQQSKDIASVSAPAPPQKPSATAPAVSASPLPSLPSGVTRNPLRSTSHPVSLPTQTQQPSQTQQPQNGPWSDLQSLQQQSRTIDATLPLQVASFQPTMSAAATQPMTISATSSTPSFLSAPTSNPFNRLSASPGAAFPSMLQQQPGNVGRSMSLGSGLSATPTGMQFGTSPFQTGMQTLQPSVSPFGSQQTLAPSPNPFSPQPLPAGMIPSGAGAGGFTPSPQPPVFMPSASPYGQSTLSQQPSQQQFFHQQPQQMFQPQPTGQFTPMTNPYGQAQSAGPGTPFMTATPQSYTGSTPSPFGQMQQPMQQASMMQQGYAMQPTDNSNTNPFTSWIQQPPQHQQQW